ncbi:site-specific integrase [Pseudoxanthomonas winnipegensis]|uniref:Site-specific integrase n=1 Tax=Pseudoxanthomonas winnipegensis TaxID=2480810 RepID=A0A4Q8LCI3_9GAMM|nr:site-specific integrase [Pseudoxanthomonas winnipegensis]TAA26584.1 site-specific integrase [Pseudoxanthomonas winnipegensis]
MATFQTRGGRCRAIVRRKGHQTQSRTFPTKTAAKAWADRVEREMAAFEARGGTPGEDVTIGKLIDWRIEELAKVKAVGKTQSGNLTRLREGLGEIEARRLTANDVIAHARRRIHGEHMMPNGKIIPAVSPATMNVELGYLTELLKLAGPMKGVKLAADPVAEARPVLRLLKMVGKSKHRDRRPTAGELDRLRAHFAAAEWRSAIPMNDIIDFAIKTAKRESEITRLLWSDLDAKTRTALLRDAKHPRQKIGNHKRFALLGDAWDLVQRQPKIDGEDRIFPYKPSSVGTAFTRACAKLAIIDLHFHDLRHEATSRLFEAGYDIPEVASVTLHSSWNELKRYTQLRPESLHRQPATPPADGGPTP